MTLARLDSIMGSPPAPSCEGAAKQHLDLELRLSPPAEAAGRRPPNPGGRRARADARRPGGGFGGRADRPGRSRPHLPMWAEVSGGGVLLRAPDTGGRDAQPEGDARRRRSGGTRFVRPDALPVGSPLPRPAFAHFDLRWPDRQGGRREPGRSSTSPVRSTPAFCPCLGSHPGSPSLPARSAPESPGVRLISRRIADRPLREPLARSSSNDEPTGSRLPPPNFAPRLATPCVPIGPPPRRDLARASLH